MKCSELLACWCMVLFINLFFIGIIYHQPFASHPLFNGCQDQPRLPSSEVHSSLEPTDWLSLPEYIIKSNEHASVVHYRPLSSIIVHETVLRCIIVGRLHCGDKVVLQTAKSLSHINVQWTRHFQLLLALVGLNFDVVKN